MKVNLYRADLAANFTMPPLFGHGNQATDSFCLRILRAQSLIEQGYVDPMRRVLEPGSVKEEDLVRGLMEASNRSEMPITCLLKGFST